MGAKLSSINSNNASASEQGSNVPNSSSISGASSEVDSGMLSRGLNFIRAGPSQLYNDRQRARSLSCVPDRSSNNYDMAGSGSSSSGSFLLPGNGQETGTFNDIILEEHINLGRVFAAHSLPAHIWSFQGLKCPVCSKLILPDDIECHLVMCLTKPRLTYNDDTLAEDKGECAICLEELIEGEIIARLPCLCIYHKPCIDRWFEVNRSCPEHPGD